MEGYVGIIKVILYCTLLRVPILYFFYAVTQPILVIIFVAVSIIVISIIIIISLTLGCCCYYHGLKIRSLGKLFELH